LSPANSVRLVLPEGESPQRYERAAGLISDWTASGILSLDADPSVTVYRQSFEGPDGPATRHALFAALELSPFERGEVLPHERTHSGPKRDRLALTLATRVQLSPVFFTAGDPEQALYRQVSEIAESVPDGTANTADGVAHATWRVSDTVACAELCDSAGTGPLLIADGHHRYETALEVRRLIGEDHPAARRVLACIVSDSDPGLRVHPTHRTIIGPPPGDSTGDWGERLADLFRAEPLESWDPATLAAAAEAAGALVLVTGAGARLLRPKPEAVQAAVLDETDLSVASVVLDRLVVEGILGSSADESAHAGRLAYFRDPAEAVAAAGADGAAFLLPAVSKEAVWKVTGLGRRLPPKSTYYEPKIPSGLLFRPLV
jgi:uncharacterized protein (DUF1015 family)